MSSSGQPARASTSSGDESPDEGPSRRVQPQRPLRRAASPHDDEEPLCTPLLLCAVLLVPCFVAAGVYLSISSEEPVNYSSGPRAPDGAPKVKDAVANLQQNLRELYMGNEFDIQIPRREVCSTCGGSGTDPSAVVVQCPACHGHGVQVYVQNFGGFQQRVRGRCNRCQGSGQVPDKVCSKCGGHGAYETKHSLHVNIPRGTRNGDQLRFEEQGNQHVGAIPGDIVLRIEELPDQLFVRQGNDLHVPLSIPLKDALLGFTAHITHLDGRAIRIAQAGVTSPGQVIRIAGEGMPVPSAPGNFGDLLVEVTVKFPPFFNGAQLEIVEQIFPEEDDEL